MNFTDPLEAEASNKKPSIYKKKQQPKINFLCWFQKGIN
jgi:hypothetical protein